MKKSYLIVYILCCYIANAQIVNIPDANFKTKLLDANIGVAIAGYSSGGNWSLTKIDINNNGQIEESEAEFITFLAISNSNILDLTGIEAFTNLIYLDCSNNQISNINFNTMSQLTTVYCNNNNIVSLDFSNNYLFNELGCSNNSDLDLIKIKNNTVQRFWPQTYFNDCWTGTSIKNICADVNEISTLQSFLNNCGVDTSIITIDSTCALGNEEFVKNKILVYPNPANDNVNIYGYENIKTLELIDIQGRMLQSQTINKSNTNIDVSGYSNGVYFIKVTSDKAQKSYKLIKN